MVNVSTDLPFNLANKVLHGRLSDVDPSSSSSRSRSAHAVLTSGPACSSALGSRRAPSYSHSHSPPPRAGRDPSPSIQTSRSNSSLHPGDASYLPPEADPTNGMRGPILNARLVRRPGAGGFGVGGTAGALRQGRTVTRGRLGRFEPGRSEDAISQGECDGEIAPGNGLVIQVEGVEGIGGETTESPLETPRATEAVPEKIIQDLSGIQDVGKLTCSWGD